MTACASDCEPHESTGNDVNPIIDDIVLSIKETSTQREESQRSQGTLVIAQAQMVSGQLLDDKTVIWQVLVEGTNNVVAVSV